MLEFGKAEQQIEARRERLLKDATARRMLPPAAHKRALAQYLAFTLGDWLIRTGTRLKTSHSPVNIPIPQSEARKS